VRRKGERKIVKTVEPYGADHSVARAIGRGSRWFDAWVMQRVTPYAVIARRTGIAESRMVDFARGAVPTRAEIEALAMFWYVTPDGLAESIEQSRRCPASGFPI
jgi:hypothetical protein